MVIIMNTNTLDNNQIKTNLVKAMLTHVPFDGWTWEAMEQGAKDIGYEKKKTSSERINGNKEVPSFALKPVMYGTSCVDPFL